MRARVRGGLEFDELVAIGAEGMLIAIQRIDPTRTKYERRSFVRLRVRGQLCDSVGEILNIPRRAWRQHREGVAPVRSQPREEAELENANWQSDPQETERSSIARRIDAQRARRAIALLPPRSAQLIRHIFIEGRSLVEAARLMGLSPSWASRLKTQALERIRERLREHN